MPTLLFVDFIPFNLCSSTSSIFRFLYQLLHLEFLWTQTEFLFLALYSGNYFKAVTRPAISSSALFPTSQGSLSLYCLQNYYLLYFVQDVLFG